MPGEPGAGGYRGLLAADGEPHATRDELSGGGPGAGWHGAGWHGAGWHGAGWHGAGWRGAARPLLVLAHLSDLHLMDHQSPGRVEMLDRYSDHGSPLREVFGVIGTYRAQELFTFQVAEAMAAAVRARRGGPVSGAPVDFAVITGDATDNSQLNELRACIDLLDGGEVTPDPARAPVSRAGFVREHSSSTGSPAGHGYGERNLADGTAYYAFDHGVVRCVVLDTVNSHGGWQGSLDEGQLRWLEAELSASAGRPVMLFSHHPLETLVNDLRPPGASRRVLAAELREVLLAHPCVVAWLNGHTHRHAIGAITDPAGRGGFWQITTASHIDWPQQARIVELLDTGRGLAIACTVLDSAAPPAYSGSDTPADLAALSRELAANDWQVRDEITAEGGAGAGQASDRNVILPVDWPRTAAQAGRR